MQIPPILIEIVRKQTICHQNFQKSSIKRRFCGSQAAKSTFYRGFLWILMTFHDSLTFLVSFVVFVVFWWNIEKNWSISIKNVEKNHHLGWFHAKCIFPPIFHVHFTEKHAKYAKSTNCRLFKGAKTLCGLEDEFDIRKIVTRRLLAESDLSDIERVQVWSVK